MSLRDFRPFFEYNGREYKKICALCVHWNFQPEKPLRGSNICTAHPSSVQTPISYNCGEFCLEAERITKDTPYEAIVDVTEDNTPLTKQDKGRSKTARKPTSKVTVAAKEVLPSTDTSTDLSTIGEQSE
ncbi:MAG: hypothetical protein D4S01_08435 [Dehalococcoidia bacterium]|nr:MAG: hypothetical protein D4S01_08435 [Dehalococcoidia bacterium]